MTADQIIKLDSIQSVLSTIPKYEKAVPYLGYSRSKDSTDYNIGTTDKSKRSLVLYSKGKPMHVDSLINMSAEINQLKAEIQYLKSVIDRLPEYVTGGDQKGALPGNQVPMMNWGWGNFHVKPKK